jgi:hypothetical protein
MRNLFCSEELEAGDPAILEDDLLGREERHKLTLLLQKTRVLLKF